MLDWKAAAEAVFQHPLFGIGITLAIYQLALAIYEWKRWALLHPMLISIVLITLLLIMLSIPYQDYRNSTQMMTLLLGPATVALAVPLYLNLKKIRELLLPTLITITVAGVIATGSGVALAWLFGLTDELLMSLLPKSVTTPIAMLVADQTGGIAALAAVFVMITGIAGALFGPELLRVFGIRNPAAVGMALGLSAHAMGTSRALQEGDECGAFSALAMSLMGALTAILLPIIVPLLI